MSASPVLESERLVQLWQPLARQGHHKAQYILGRAYAQGRGAPQDERRALHWLRKAADTGNPDAQTLLANMYAKGLGTRCDYARAGFWFRKAAEQGVIKAQYSLSRMYAGGVGVPRSYIYAYMWAMLAATGGGRPGSRSPGDNELRNKARHALEAFAQHMSHEETSAAIRMTKRWREKQARRIQV